MGGLTSKLTAVVVDVMEVCDSGEGYVRRDTTPGELSSAHGKLATAVRSWGTL